MMTRIKHLYIHVPFCNSICSYCDFCHRVYDEDLSNKWLDVVSKEIKDKCKNNYETIYIGGGTPTSLSNNQLDKLLSCIDQYAKEVVEYTIEVNPESLDINKINIFKKHGINRISMGVQTSNPDLLKLINRKHSFEEVKDKIKLLKDNGLNNISIDLMYSLPTQTIDILNKTIDDFISLDIPHVSLYSLTVEENSVFGKKGYKQLDEDIEADMYELIVSRLQESGYIHYEVSNFSRPGYESKHNIGYWDYEDFLGISMSSSSKVEDKRWTITRNFDDYFNDYNCKDEYLLLSKEDMMFENIMMSLRTNKGLNIIDFNKKYNCDLLNEYRDAIKNDNIYIENDYLKVKNLAILNNTLINFIKN